MQASTVICARDEAGAIARTLDLLAAQTAEHEVIVVDSDPRRIARLAGRWRGRR